MVLCLEWLPMLAFSSFEFEFSDNYTFKYHKATNNPLSGEGGEKKKLKKKQIQGFASDFKITVVGYIYSNDSKISQ